VLALLRETEVFPATTPKHAAIPLLPGNIQTIEGTPESVAFSAQR